MEEKRPCGEIVSLDDNNGFATYCTRELGHEQTSTDGCRYNPAETTSANGWVGNVVR